MKKNQILRQRMTGIFSLICMMLLLSGCNHQLPNVSEGSSGNLGRETTDERFSTGFVVSDGKTYYITAQGKSTGLITVDGKQYYFDETGAMQTGVQEISGDFFCFSPDGGFVTGPVSEGEKKWYFDHDGKSVTGWYHDENNARRYYQADGSLADGWVPDGEISYRVSAGLVVPGFVERDDGKRYYVLPDGNYATGLQTIDGVTYFFREDFSMATGAVKVGSSTYFFDSDGRLNTGWVTKNNNTYYYSKGGWMYFGFVKIGGKMYHFDEKTGIMDRNKTVGIYKIDENGVATPVPLTTANLEDYVKGICTQEKIKTPQDIYNYVRGHMTYKTMAKGELADMAVYAINYQRGSCYYYAALTYYLSKACGYDAHVIIGRGLDVNGDGVPDSEEHAWVLIQYDGAWRHLDPLQKQYLKTDNEILARGYEWDRSAFPAAR